MGYLHQLSALFPIEAALPLDDDGLRLCIRVVELQRGKALFGGLLQILHQALVAGIVRDHQLKVGVRLDQLPLLVQRQGTPVVGQGVNHHRGVLTCLDDLVQITDPSHPRRHGQRPILPARPLLVEEEAAHQIGGGHVLIAGNRYQGLAQPPGHVFHETGFATAGGTLDHYRKTFPVGRFIELDLVRLWLIEGLLADLVLFVLAHLDNPHRLLAQALLSSILVSETKTPASGQGLLQPDGNRR